MFDSSAFTAALTEAFDKYDKHFDRFILETAIDQQLRVYPTLDLRESLHMRRSLEGFLAQAFCDTEPLDLAPEKMGIFLERIVSRHKTLTPVIGHAMKQASYDNDYTVRGIPYLQELSGLSVLSAETDDYVRAHIERSAKFFPAMCLSLNGSRFVQLVEPSLINHYMEEATSGGDPEEAARHMRELSVIPEIWNIAQAHDGIHSSFGCYTPDLGPQMTALDIKKIGASYTFEYDETHHFVSGSFMYVCLNGGLPDTDWVKRFSPSALSGAYVLLSHMQGVMNGKRDGGIITDPDWTSRIDQLLKPVIVADAQAVADRMRQLGIALPPIPATQMPGSVNWQAHQAGMRAPSFP